MEFISHPLTIAALVLLGGAFGWIVTSIIAQGKDLTRQHGMIETLTQTAADIKELLIITRDEQKLLRGDLDDLRIDHAKFSGECKKKRLRTSAS